MEKRLTEQDGRIALHDHVLERALAARERYGPVIDADAIMRMLDDRQIVRYPVSVRFDAAGLAPGEFAHAAPFGEHPRDGFCLLIHPDFEHRRDLWPSLIAYHVPPINYGEIAEAEDCELFGATVVGLEPEAYYAVLCDAADSIRSPDQSAER